MTADEINEGLAKYMGWQPGFAMGGAGWFTDSLDACSRVADKLGVKDIDIEALAEGFVTYVRIGDYYRGKFGPTRAHALAAALYAAVEATE